MTPGEPCLPLLVTHPFAGTWEASVDSAPVLATAIPQTGRGMPVHKQRGQVEITDVSPLHVESGGLDFTENINMK